MPMTLRQVPKPLWLFTLCRHRSCLTRVTRTSLIEPALLAKVPQSCQHLLSLMDSASKPHTGASLPAHRCIRPLPHCFPTRQPLLPKPCRRPLLLITASASCSAKPPWLREDPNRAAIGGSWSPSAVPLRLLNTRRRSPARYQLDLTRTTCVDLNLRTSHFGRECASFRRRLMR